MKRGGKKFKNQWCRVTASLSSVIVLFHASSFANFRSMGQFDSPTPSDCKRPNQTLFSSMIRYFHSKPGTNRGFLMCGLLKFPPFCINAKQGIFVVFCVWLGSSQTSCIGL